MKQSFVFLCLCAAATSVLLFFGVQSVRAVDADEPAGRRASELSFFNSVDMDCSAVVSKLGTIHQQDGLLRVTLGQDYEVTSSKLMARLNARVVENKLDGAALIKTAAEFESTLRKFRDNYRLYEVSMNNLMRMNCQAQVQEFYASLESTRELRDAVNRDVKKLSELVDRYYQEFLEFRKQLETKDEVHDAAE